MLQKRTRVALIAVLLLGLIAAVVFSARGRAQPSPTTPTIDLGAVRTEAVSIFSRDLTRTAAAVPTITASPSPPAATETAATDALSPTPSCLRLKFVRDMSIPDNTPMTPAEVFTKTWQVENNGICAWRKGFQLVLIGGVAMGGSPFTLESTVNPGGRIEISIKMVAPPNETGIVRGTWRMVDENATPFGDAIYVQIVIGSGTAAGATTTAVATATP